MQTQYLLEPSVLSNRYHLQMVKEKLTRILPNILPDVVDEISVAVTEHIAAAENGTSPLFLLSVINADYPNALHRVDQHKCYAGDA